MYLYTSASNEAPKIKNTYGDLNKVINYILDGGVQHSVTRIENYSESKAHTIKIYYAGDTCPYAQFQTINITGATYPEYNKRFFIEVINTVEKYIICYRSDLASNIPNDDSPSIKMKIHNAGFTRKHGGISDNITVIKFVGGMEYRIDDRDIRDLANPPIVKDSQNETWFKVARVTMSGNFDSLYSSLERTYPQTPKQPDQVFNMVNNNFCPAFIRYSISNNYYLTQTIDLNLVRETTYKILADETCMYILLNSPVDGEGYKYVYALGGFETLNPEIKNGILFAGGYYGKSESYNFQSSSAYSSSSMVRPYGNYSNILFKNDDISQDYNEIYTHNIIYNNGNEQPDYMRRMPELSFSPYLSGIDGLSFPNPVNNALYFCDVIIVSGKDAYARKYYGKMHNLKWACNSMGLGNNDGLIYEIDGDKYYEYLHYCNQSTSNMTRNYIKLTIE